MLKRLKTKPLVIAFYRRAVRVINSLPAYDQQRIWYDYLKLKLEENATLRDETKIRHLLATAHEELDWVISIRERDVRTTK